MSAFLEDTNSTVARTLLAAEVGYVTASGGLFVVGGNAVTMGDAFLGNWGTIHARGDAVYLTAAGAEIENHGSITGADVAAINGFSGISGNTLLTVTNYGDILLTNDGGNSAILCYGGGNRIINHGTISVHQGETIAIGDANLNEVSSGNRIENSGSIISTSGIAIGLTNNDNDTLHNTGEIVGDVTLGSGDDVFYNTGRILGAVTLFGQISDFWNAGTILGDVTTSGTVQMSGHIEGLLILSAGTDTVDLRGGTVSEGIVDFGGADTYLVDAPTTLITDNYPSGADLVKAWCDFTLSFGLEKLELYGTAVRGTGNQGANDITGTEASNLLQGMAGDDTVIGGAGFDTVTGGSGADWLLGGDDEDRLDGGDANDLVQGDNGDDLLRGRAGIDRLEGGNDEDTLYGGLATDTLSGGAGDDVLLGGAGTDRLQGGTESDSFVFLRVSDSKLGATHDTITDFVVADDVIDLSAIDARALTAANDVFSFIGTTAFTLGTSGQLRFVGSGVNILVQGDVNGDAVADLEIQVNFLTSITAASFVL